MSGSKSSLVGDVVVLIVCFDLLVPPSHDVRVARASDVSELLGSLTMQRRRRLFVILVMLSLITNDGKRLDRRLHTAKGWPRRHTAPPRALLLDPPRCPWCPRPPRRLLLDDGAALPIESRSMTTIGSFLWPHGQLGMCSSVTAAPPACARARDALGRLVELVQAEVPRRLLFMTCRRPSCA